MISPTFGIKATDFKTIKRTKRFRLKEIKNKEAFLMGLTQNPEVREGCCHSESDSRPCR